MQVEIKEVRRLVRLWKKRFALHQWKIFIHVYKTEEEVVSEKDQGAEASIDIEPSYSYATIYINPFEVVALEPAIVHELLHIVMSPVETMLKSALEGRLGEMVDETIEKTIEIIQKAIMSSNKKTKHGP